MTTENMSETKDPFKGALVATLLGLGGIVSSYWSEAFLFWVGVPFLILGIVGIILFNPLFGVKR